MTGRKSGNDVLEDVFGSDWGSDDDEANREADVDEMVKDGEEREKRRRRSKEDGGDDKGKRVKKTRKKKTVDSEDEYSDVGSADERKDEKDEPERKTYGGKSVRKMKRKKEEREKKEEEEGDDEEEEDVVQEDEIVPVRNSEQKVRQPIVFSDDDADDEDDVAQRNNRRKRKLQRSNQDSVPGRRHASADTARRDDDDHHHADPSDDEHHRRRSTDRRNSQEDHRIRIRKKPRLDKLPSSSAQPTQDDHFISDDDQDDAPPFDDHDDREEDPASKKQKRQLSAFEKGVEEIKALRRPRKREVDPAQIEAECVAFLERMMKARDDDLKAYNSGKPALEKLKMLRSVELMLMKVQYREQLMDNMLLAIIKAWLDPMPDGALPNLEIRTSLLNILHGMRVDNDWVERLHTSQGLGRVVHYLSRSETHLPNKRLAEKIMRKWARPVYNSNANFHDLLEEFNRVDHVAPKDGVASERQAAREAIKNFKTSTEKIMEFKKRPGNTRPDQIMATVPRRTPFLFTTLAEGVHGVDEKQIREMRAAKARNKRVNRTMATLRRANKQRSARAAKPSLTGRR